jgi:hypothetical protein
MEKPEEECVHEEVKAEEPMVKSVNEEQKPSELEE